MAKLSSRKFNYNHSTEFFRSSLQIVGCWLVISIAAVNKSTLTESNREGKESNM